MPKHPVVAPAGKLSGKASTKADLAASYIIVSLMHAAVQSTNSQVKVADVVKLATAAKNTVFTELHATLHPQYEQVQATIKTIKARARKVIGNRLHSLLAREYTIKRKSATQFKLNRRTFNSNNIAAVEAYQELLLFNPVLQNNSSNPDDTIDAQALRLTNAVNTVAAQFRHAPAP